uniref:Retrotransposon gag domain-containing protein n=1 Tax=Fagus sylvatica TaxID=28930 RepID=A0A2N9J6N2_FAGSY
MNKWRYDNFISDYNCGVHFVNKQIDELPLAAFCNKLTEANGTAARAEKVQTSGTLARNEARRQQGQQGQQAQLEPILVMVTSCRIMVVLCKASNLLKANVGWGKGNWGRARNYQGPKIEILMERIKIHSKGNKEGKQGSREQWSLNFQDSRESNSLRFGPPSYDDPMELLIKLKHVNSIEEYKGLFESLSNRAIPANVKGSTRPSYEANKDNWEQYSSQEVAAQFVPKVAAQIDPKVTTQLDPKREEGKAYATIVMRVGLCGILQGHEIDLIEEVQEEEGAYVTNDEEEERVEWCEERPTPRRRASTNIQVPSRYWLIGRSLMKKQLEDSSSIRHNKIQP